MQSWKRITSIRLFFLSLSLSLSRSLSVFAFFPFEPDFFAPCIAFFVPLSLKVSHSFVKGEGGGMCPKLADFELTERPSFKAGRPSFKQQSV